MYTVVAGSTERHIVAERIEEQWSLKCAYVIQFNVYVYDLSQNDPAFYILKLKSVYFYHHRLGEFAPQII